MASVARGLEEEVFETPDFAEDDLLAPGGQVASDARPDSSLSKASIHKAILLEL